MTPETDFSLIGGTLDQYDYLTFAIGIAALIAFFAIFIFIIMLPGKVAIRRSHPHAESVKLMGLMGFLAVVPWMHAFMWAFHDSLTIDVRRFPKAEKKAIEEEIRRLRGDEDVVSELEIVDDKEPESSGDAKA
ncbi:MAG: superinfection immunity protein [Stappiaceae bacterium]